MRTVKIFAFVACLFPTFAHAADYRGITYTVEPIVGYTYQRNADPVGTKLALTYGARVVAGYKILSGEAEYTIANTDSEFPTTPERIQIKTEEIRAGLRSTYSLGSFLDWFLRGGAEVQRTHTKDTVAGVLTESDSPSDVYPYVGTGVSIALGSTLDLNADVTATVKDLHDMKQNEYRTTVGIQIAVGGY
jgi:hypothetical protein